MARTKGRFISSAATVARPVGVRPTTVTPRHWKWRAQRWRRGWKIVTLTVKQRLQPSLDSRGQPEACEIVRDLQLDGNDLRHATILAIEWPPSQVGHGGGRS